MDKNNIAILKFYAISPMHAGSGDSVATVDLPIQRERHTNYPCIYASAVKGAMRAHFREFISKEEENYVNPDNKFAQVEKLINFIFGSDKDNDEWNGKLKHEGGNDEKSVESLPGAISVSDAKLLAFPMRSNIAPFVWVTCPTILGRLRKDLEFSFSAAGGNFVPFEITGNDAKIIISNENKFKDVKKVIIEDAVVNVVSKDPALENFLNKNFSELNNLLLISDDMFGYCVSSCTEIQTNVKISSKTGTADDGSLRYQEFLPSDSVLYSIVNFKSQENKYNVDLKSDIIAKHVKDVIKDFIQVGGDETLGKGICKIEWINNENDSKAGVEK